LHYWGLVRAKPFLLDPFLNQLNYNYSLTARNLPAG
jgi:hypothetical protein